MDDIIELAFEFVEEVLKKKENRYLIVGLIALVVLLVFVS